MSKTGKADDDLGAHFAAARCHAPEPEADFLARVLADAETVQDGFAAAAATARAGHAVRPRAGGWRGVFQSLGGWPAMVGLSAAAVTGLWIGAVPPEGLSTTAQMVWGEDVTLAFEPDLGIELFPGEEG
ncbi:MAG: hypothetical protein ACE369_11715 [Roseovarius sp.]